MKQGTAKIPYSTGQYRHFDICNSFHVKAPSGEPEHVSVHGGWELNFSPGVGNYSPLRMRLRGKTHVVLPNRFLAFNSVEEHVEVYPTDRQSQALAIVFPVEILRTILEETGICPEEVAFNDVDHVLNDDLGGILRKIYSLRSTKSRRIAFECLSIEFLLKMMKLCPSTASAKLSKELARGSFPSNIIRTKRVIAENLGNADFSLDELSAQAGISKFHLIRSFKDRTGLSPVRYLNLTRIELSKSLLSKGESVSEVALQTGFSTFSAFNKSFNRHVGKSPSRYRATKE